MKSARRNLYSCEGKGDRKILVKKERKKIHVKKGGLMFSNSIGQPKTRIGPFSLFRQVLAKESAGGGWVLCGWLLMFSTPRGYNKRTPLRHEDRTRKKFEGSSSSNRKKEKDEETR
jgi:hypothetical protein